MRSKLNLSISIFLFTLIGYFSLAYISPEIVKPQGVDFSYLGHFIAYFLLSASLFLYFSEKEPDYKKSISLAAFYGFLLELIQFYISYRSFSFIDLGINILGASFIIINIYLNLANRFLRIESRILDSINV